VPTGRLEAVRVSVASDDACIGRRFLPGRRQRNHDCKDTTWLPLANLTGVEPVMAIMVTL